MQQASTLETASVREDGHLRPNLFVNTPDILHASLQYGGPPVFAIRAVLAAMLSPPTAERAGHSLAPYLRRLNDAPRPALAARNGAYHGP